MKNIFRIKANTGLWLGILIGLSAILTLLEEDTSYSEICLIVGLTGIGLIISSICLYSRLSSEKITVKDFQAIYFLPAIITSLLYLFVANKGTIYKYYFMLLIIFCHNIFYIILIN